ncbi:MAG: hypothetical protein HKO59_14375 [Phycisphaerales bacterium]|nr:hypothetical protein [Phycisphaerae bacterium]NNF43196.1 hypothetical protein [Phycisphaerales bacterium]NNM27146.1 hypothetical protein [Phycisphaerales bacterium]
MSHPIEIIEENEGRHGWSFRAQILDDAGGLHVAEVTLSWADYNHWSASGSDTPSAVAAAVVRFMLTHLAPAEVPARFDAATTRQRYPDADGVIPSLIG